MAPDRPSDRDSPGLLFAHYGTGPLLQRDYWAVIDRSRLSPPQVAALLAERFCSFSAPALARFERAGRLDRPLDVGDELEVTIRFAGRFRIRVTHRDRNSLTFTTLRGHPEAGRITFGAYRSERGEVIFHIRSRARSSGTAQRAAFRALGQSVQATLWAHFVERVASEAGGGVAGLVHEETSVVQEEEADAADEPTFLALGD